MVVVEVLVMVDGGGGGHGEDGGGGHFQMANVDYPPNSEPITPITRKKKNMGASRSHMVNPVSAFWRPTIFVFCDFVISIS